MGIYRRLLVFLRPHWWRLAGNIAANVVGAALDAVAFLLLIPFLNTLFQAGPEIPITNKFIAEILQRVVGRLLVPGNPVASLTGVSIMIVALVVVKNVFLWLGGQFGASLQEKLTRDLRDAVFRHMQRLPLSWFSRTKAGQIIARILTDTEQAKAILAEVATRSIQNLAQVLVTIAVLFGLSPRLALWSLVVAPLISLVLQPLLRKLRKGHRRLRNEYGEITSVLQEVISGARLVKSFRGEYYEDERFTSASGAYTKGMVRITRISLLSGPLTEVLATIVAIGVLGIGAREVFAKTLDAGVLVTFMIYVMRLLPPFKQLSQAPTIAQQSLAAAERLFQILDEPTEEQRDKGTRTASGLTHAIEFAGVSFSYGDENVLTDVAFTAHRGDVIALVGASGGGKSTLVDLIPRFIEPTQGAITLDGVDTRDITLASLRALTGIVSQDTVLFNDTVRANIAYGSADRYSREQVEAAARAANAHTFISELPQGYDTILGERGTRLSGGQRQRIAIARALLIDPPVLILDEATSALDTESERLVQEAIDRLLAGRTVFVIAHRLSTVTHATLILVLDRGRVIERGTHAALLAKGGAYARLHALQSGAESETRPLARLIPT
jgi:subfamily B ATP-binding cassette protein MsbA